MPTRGSIPLVTDLIRSGFSLRNHAVNIITNSLANSPGIKVIGPTLSQRVALLAVCPNGVKINASRITPRIKNGIANFRYLL